MIRCLAHIEQAGTIMRTARLLTILSILLFALALPAAAQRTRRPAPKPKPKPTPQVTRTSASPIVAAAKQKVATQLQYVNVFVQKIGPIAVGIENLDKDAAARKLKQSEIDLNDNSKKKVVTMIQTLRVALVDLEAEFRAKPALAAYLPKIQGISDLGAQSEDSALAGKFVAAKDPIRQVALKLNETLLVMPGPVAGVPMSSSRPAVPVSTSSTVSRPAASPASTAGRRSPAVGMTPAEVLASSWGEPSGKRTSSTANGSTEVWTYAGKRTIYFFKGRVSNITQ